MTTGLIEKWQAIEQWAYDNADVRSRDLFFVNSPLPALITVVVYVLFISQGPKWMKHRQAFSLQPFLVIYNLGLVLLSLYMCWELLKGSYDAGYSYICQPYRINNDPTELRIVNALWWYYFSKVIELMDTVFMVLRKKNNQISFLHVYHHTVVLLVWYIVLLVGPSGMSFFGPLLNCFVHVLMYLYYGLSAIPSLRKFLWWKSYLTKLQLLQFVIILTQQSYALYLDCDFPRALQWFQMGFLSTLVILFSNFYIHAYIKKIDTSHKRKESHSKASISNGETSGLNGYLKISNGEAAIVNGKASMNGQASVKKRH